MISLGMPEGWFAMITLLPYADFVKSARCLDNAHLILQIKDVNEILDLLNGELQDSDPRFSHKSVQMWRGHEFQLAEYGITLCTELKLRDVPEVFIKDLGMYQRRIEWQQQMVTSGTNYTVDMPYWFGDSKIHLSHRSYLMRYDVDHYGLYFNTDTPLDLPIVWPQILTPMQSEEVE